MPQPMDVEPCLIRLPDQNHTCAGMLRPHLAAHSARDVVYAVVSDALEGPVHTTLRVRSRADAQRAVAKAIETVDAWRAACA